MKMIKNLIPIFFTAIILFSSMGIARAQTQLSPQAVLNTFPYQQSADATAALTSMDSWKSADWKTFFNAVEDTAQQTKFTYALHAYVNKVAQKQSSKIVFIEILSKQLKKTKLELKSLLF
jgi:hypothetical protein